MPNVAIPQHRQLSELLKDDILRGVYEPGDLLPSEHALCEEHHVTRPTVRHALSTLVHEGLIKKHKGKGSIVQPKRGGIGILNLVGTTDSLPAGDLQTHVIHAPTAGRWPSTFPFRLDAETRGVGCIEFGRLRSITGKPIFYERTFLPNDGLPGFLDLSLEDRSLFRTLSHHYGLTVTNGEQRIWSLGADADIADLLAVEPGTPILQLYKAYETSRPSYTFYSMLWCDTQDFFLQGNL